MPSAEISEKKPKSKKGGYRPGSGRKPLISKSEVERVKQLIEQHSVEIDPKDEKKRARILRVLDTLYEEGVKKNNIRRSGNISTGSSGRARSTLNSPEIFRGWEFWVVAQF